MAPGAEIALRIDQTLTQDATGTMVMLELEALGPERAQTRVSVQYVDHNLRVRAHRGDHRPADAGRQARPGLPDPRPARVLEREHRHDPARGRHGAALPQPELEDAEDQSRIEQGDRLVVDDVRSALSSGGRLTLRNESKDEEYDVRHRLSPRQVEMVLAGGLIPWLRSAPTRSNLER